eukprot:jgi/Tetstr1/456104/TSEL_042873.t1
MGVQRRSRMPRMAMTEIRLEPGDVLLLAGGAEDIKKLRNYRDVLLLDWSAAEVPPRRLAPRALAIFSIMVFVSATGLVPIVTASVAATFALIATGCLNVRQALRAVDSRIFMLIGASIASATALEVTGGARAIADLLVAQLQNQPPMIVLSALYLLVMMLTNMLSNNATAVLFTPIAVNMAGPTGLPVEAFVTCVIFAANSSFATPIGYQTNLIVMGPGHYRFFRFSHRRHAACHFALANERKVFTHLVGSKAQTLNDVLTQGGFRRSQNIAYRPACEDCKACISVRVRVDDFRWTRAFRRLWRKNADIIGTASLGTHLILDHIERARGLGLPYVYLGYWVKGSPKMDYKARFQPQELLGPEGWAPAETEAPSAPD